MGRRGPLYRRKVAVKWLGRHSWRGDAKYQGKITLSAGVHDLKLYHVNLSGVGGAVVAWQTPGQEKFQVIAPTDFLPVAKVSLGLLENRKRYPLPDFSYRVKSFSLVNWRGIYVYEFQALGKHPKYTTFHWDFGDGQTATGEKVEHLFLHETDYPISLRVVTGKNSKSNSSRVYIGPDRADYRSKQQQLKSYVPMLSKYDYARLPLFQAITAIELYDIAYRPDLAAQAGLGVLKGYQLSAKSNPKHVHQWGTLLGSVLTDQLGRYAEAAMVYQECAKYLGKTPAQKHELLIKQADVLVNNLGLDKEAETVLKTIAAPTTQPTKTMSTPLLTAWGDIWRFRNNRPLAEKFYRVVQDQSDTSQYFARCGAYSGAIEDFLRRKEYAKALDLLDTWQREYPVQRLGDYSCYLLFRLYTQQNRPAQAQRYSQIIARIDPMGFYARKMADVIAEMKLPALKPGVVPAAPGKIKPPAPAKKPEPKPVVKKPVVAKPKAPATQPAAKKPASKPVPKKAAAPKPKPASKPASTKPAPKPKK